MRRHPLLSSSRITRRAVVGGAVGTALGVGTRDGRSLGLAATPSPGSVAVLWQTQGDPADPLGNPARVAIAPDGAIWVADGDNHRFLIFAPDGTLLEAWGTQGSGDGEFDFTTVGWGGYEQGAVAFAPDGSLYVVEPGNHRVQKFGPDRSFLFAWGSEGRGPGQFVTPLDLVVDAQGRVYVVDADRNALPADADVGGVQVFDADGRFLAEWGARGTGLRGTEAGQLSEPLGIALDSTDGTIIVVEYGNSRVQRFTPEGKFLDGWGEYGFLHEGVFARPTDVAVDAQGRVYVADYANHRVQAFDRDGGFLTAWGENGVGAGEFTYPIALAVGDDGTVYVTDDVRRLQAFRSGDLPVPAATPMP